MPAAPAVPGRSISGPRPRKIWPTKTAITAVTARPIYASKAGWIRATGSKQGWPEEVKFCRLGSDIPGYCSIVQQTHFRFLNIRE